MKVSDWERARSARVLMFSRPDQASGDMWVITPCLDQSTNLALLRGRACLLEVSHNGSSECRTNKAEPERVKQGSSNTQPAVGRPAYDRWRT